MITAQHTRKQKQLESFFKPECELWGLRQLNRQAGKPDAALLWLQVVKDGIHTLRIHK